MAARGVLTEGFSHSTTGRTASVPSVWARLRRVIQVVSTRNHLTEMDDRMLADVGLTRSDAFIEMNRAPWDIETKRRR